MVNLIKVPVNVSGLTNPEYVFLQRDYNFLTNSNSLFIGGMPVTLTNNCSKQLLRTKNDIMVYNMTLKVDGERYLLFLSSNGHIYFIDRLLNFFFLVNENNIRLKPMNPEIVKPFIFDGEMVFHKSTKEYEYLIFDVLYYQGEPYIGKDYYTRLDLINFAYSNVLKGYFEDYNNNMLLINPKLWFPISMILKSTNVYKDIKSMTNKSRPKKYQLEADGVILQPFDTPYVVGAPWNKNNNVLFKWKPKDEQTIDFEIKILKPNEWQLLTKSGYPLTMPVTGIPAICKPTEANKRGYVNGDVVECNYVGENVFKIKHPRPNKQANSKETALSVLEFIRSPFNLESLKPAIDVLVSGEGDIKNILMNYSKSDLILCIMKNYVFFNDSEIKKIKEIYELYQDGMELEFRLSMGENRKGMDKFVFTYLLEYLVGNFEFTFNETISVSSKESRSTYLTFEDAKNGNTFENISKVSIKKFDMKSKNKLYQNIGFRLSLSDEKKVSKTVPMMYMDNGKRINNNIRIKSRYSFNVGLWRIDMTIVKSGYTESDVLSKSPTYEIEGELINQPGSFDEFLNSFSNVYMMLLSNSSYC